MHGSHNNGLKCQEYRRKHYVASELIAVIQPTRIGILLSRLRPKRLRDLEGSEERLQTRFRGLSLWFESLIRSAPLFGCASRGRLRPCTLRNRVLLSRFCNRLDLFREWLTFNTGALFSFWCYLLELALKVLMFGLGETNDMTLTQEYSVQQQL